MKTLLGTLILLFAMQTVSTAQCSVNFEKEYKDKLEGTYLMDFEVKNKPDSDGITKFTVLMREGSKYIIYMTNPSVPLTDIKLTVTRDEQYLKLESDVNAAENYITYNLKPKETGAYHLYIEFRDKTIKSCVALALYLDEDK
ncbi:MAG: hypothetical protein PHD00_01655 [Bacteroidales bacterium]|nr:hypothetical protein [Bacteroidales bacterium]MDD4672787.1 hypothetical protein [Bacteroidales bacterium]